MLGTPASRDVKGANGPEHFATRERAHLDQLPNQALLHTELWTTPTVRDSNSIAKITRGAGSMEKGNQLVQPIGLQAACQTGTPPGSKPEPMASAGQLNPDFVCWLMGYPAGWLNYADSATPSSRKSSSKSGGRLLRQRSEVRNQRSESMEGNHEK